MDSVYEIIEKNFTLDPPTLIEKIYEEDSLSSLIDIALKIYAEIEVYASGCISDREKTLFSYSFSEGITTNRMRCGSLYCYENNIYDFTLFNTLYSDTAYIADPIDWIYYDVFQSKKSINPFALKNRLIKTLLFLIHNKQLISEGIVVIKPAITFQCPDCLKKTQAYEKNFTALFKNIEAEIEDYLLDKVSVSCNEKRELVFNAEPQYVDHGELSFAFPHPPKNSIQRTIKDLPRKLSKEEIRKEKILLTHMIRPTMIELLHTFWNPHDKRDSSYVAGSQLEIDIINMVNKNSNDLIYQNLFEGISHSLPFLQDIRLSDALKIRKGNEENFIGYRNSIARVIKDIPPNSSPEMYKEAISEYVEPQIDKLDIIFANHKKYFKGSMSSKVLLDAIKLGIGYIGGLYNPENFWGVAGVNTAGHLYEFIREKNSIPLEIRNNELYFLWQLKKSNKPRI